MTNTRNTNLSPEALAAKKKRRAQEYYQASKKKESSSEMVQNLAPRIAAFVLVLFSVATTGMLIMESAQFYGLGKTHLFTGDNIAKAVLMELSLIFLVSLTPKKLYMKVAASILTVVVFLFVTFSFSYNILNSNVTTSGKITIINSNISDLEAQLKATKESVDKYKTLGWNKNYKKAQEKTDEISNLLRAERGKLASASNISFSLLKVDIYLRIGYRVVFQLINMILVFIVRRKYLRHL
jgi:hypothetical protein